MNQVCEIHLTSPHGVFFFVKLRREMSTDVFKQKVDEHEPAADEEELRVLAENLTDLIMKDEERREVAEIVLTAAINAKHYGVNLKAYEEITSLRALRDKVLTVIAARNYSDGCHRVLSPG